MRLQSILTLPTRGAWIEISRKPPKNIWTVSEDAKKGKIDSIIVKDLSRLGRDYISAGDYLEQIFPVLGVRFIAVNSSYDSNDYIGQTVGLDVSISNLLNSLYSKDISKR